jgi:hypothetical protein
VRRAYQALLRLYPGDYRAFFAAEMWNAFEQAAEERRGQGWPVFFRFALAELIGLVAGAGTEWFAKLTTDSSVRGRHLPDLRLMRPPGIPRELWFAAPCANEVTEAQRRVTFLVSRVVYAIANHDFEGARTFSRQEQRERENLRLLREKYKIDE